MAALASRQSPARPERSPARRPLAAPGPNLWAIALTVTMATFMELLDTSISNVSLPHIAGGLGTSYDESTWILTSYLVANAIILPMSAWLSQVFGRKRYYMMSVTLFTATSFLCGIAPSLGMLILFRVLQGIGGGGLAPVEQAILVDTFPSEKLGGAFALYSMAIVTAPAIGPPLGGWITDSFSWRWVFFINIPIGLLSLILSSRLIHDPPEFTQERKRAWRGGALRIDYVGIILIAVGFACLEVVLDRGERDDWLGSHFITAFLAIAVVAIGIAIWWEWRHREPVVELTLLRERNFAIANVYYFLFAFGLFGSTVLIPEMLQTLFGYTATDAGLVLGPGALVITLLAPFVVRIVPRTGARLLLGVCFTIASLSFFYYSGLTIQTDYFHYTLARCFQGFGYAFMFVPVSQVAYSYLPRNKNNKGSSLTNLCRNWGGSFGIAFVTTMLERRTQYHQSVLVANLTSADASVRQFLSTSSHYLVTRGSSGPDALHQAYGVAANMMTQQATMLAFMDCFHLLAFVVILGLPLAFLVRRFEIGKAGGAAH
ncbi:MAG TPA: DHA2 family efflux MFS transporter permease subunit [Candidatus Binataceae bacterium]|jgi:DHA2 family multidrug resistance protein|nr:DHA2 family efflux MFS transporter permease subunit [Candidatus Binataceae bacterium]